MADVVVFRHWPAKYEILKQYPKKIVLTPEEFLQVFGNVVDLTSVEEIEGYLEKLLKKIDFSKYKKIHIWVSPFWRTIHTARIIIERLKEKGINPQKIKLFSTIEEVRWFDWEIHKALCEWWEITLSDWKKVKINKNITNPDNLTFTDYFFNDAIKEIDKNYLEKIWLKEYVENVEKYEEIVKRSLRTLYRILDRVGEDKVVILITHQAFVDEIVREKFNYNKYWGLEPWEYLIIKHGKENVERWKDILRSKWKN